MMVMAPMVVVLGCKMDSIFSLFYVNIMWWCDDDDDEGFDYWWLL